MTQRELKYSIFANWGKIMYPGKWVALGKGYAKNPVKDFYWFWRGNSLKFTIIKARKHQFSDSCITNRQNESTVPRYSQWQFQKISKPLVKKIGFGDKFEAKLNLKFVWYFLMKLFTANGWHDWNFFFFCGALMGMTYFEIIITRTPVLDLKKTKMDKFWS